MNGRIGKVIRCVFRNSGNDSLDLMTSKVVVERTALYDSGDKGISVGENTTLLHALLVQAASLEPTDSFLLAYLKGDWNAAQKLSSQLSSGSAELLTLKSEVDRKLAEAHEFSELLSSFRKR